MDELMDRLPSFVLNFTDTTTRHHHHSTVNGINYNYSTVTEASLASEASQIASVILSNLTSAAAEAVATSTSRFTILNSTIAPFPSLAEITSSSFASSAASFGTTTTTVLNDLEAAGDENGDDGTPKQINVQTILISIILLAVILGTIIGNILVCVAVCLVRKLRRPCNYLLVSLAVSDLCVAVLVMPTALMYEVLNEWRFGTFFCDVWVSFDVLSCTASILNLCAISVDRFWAITKPLEYGVKRTPRRMMMCVVLVWLGAACISLPPLLILGNEHQIDGRPACLVCQNFGYQIYATFGSFYLPLAVMLFVYYQIFRAARRIVMDEKRAQTRLEGALNGGPQQTTTTTQEKPINAIGSPHQKKLRFQLAKERKASTTLGIIMSAFTVCWLPFFILALVKPITGEEYHTLSSIFLWLGYANSLLNPIIYATLNRDFRKPFQEILYFRCSSLNILMREDFYHSQYGDPHSQRVVVNTEITQHNSNQGARESFL
jgi:5-hydroxytryptamine receptor 7